MIALVLLIAAGVLHIAFNVTGIFRRGGDLHWVNTGRGISYGTDSGAVFHGAPGPFFYSATREGVRYISSATGEIRLHDNVNLRRPEMRGRGEYAAVAEGERGRAVYVFNPSGRVMTETFDYPVQYFSVNASGFLSVILQMDDGYSVNVFHRNSVYRPMFRSFYNEANHPHIIPVMAEVSDDGRFIVIAYLDYGNRLQSYIHFVHTYSSDAWGTDGIFFGDSFDDELLMAMRLTANNRLVAVTDAQIVVYTRNAGGVVSKTATIPLYNRIDQLAFDEEGRFAIALGNADHVSFNTPPAGTVQIFDANGVLTGTYSAGRNVTHLSMGHGLVIVGTDRTFYAFNLQGEKEWEFIALHGTRDFIFLENGDTLLIAGATRADVWRRQRNRNNGNGDFFGIQGQ